MLGGGTRRRSQKFEEILRKFDNPGEKKNLKNVAGGMSDRMQDKKLITTTPVYGGAGDIITSQKYTHGGVKDEKPNAGGGPVSCVNGGTSESLPSYVKGELSI